MDLFLIASVADPISREIFSSGTPSLIHSALVHQEKNFPLIFWN
jgi:hypothetical protein